MNNKLTQELNADFIALAWRATEISRQCGLHLQAINAQTSQVARFYKNLTHCEAQELKEIRVDTIRIMREHATHLQTIASVILDNADYLDKLNVYE